MEKKKRRVRLPVCVLACVLCLAVGASAALIGVRTMLGEDGVTILQAARIIQERFVGDYDRDAYRQAVLGAMVDDLGDRWSYYLTPEEYASVQDARRNAYVGIGITVDRTACASSPSRRAAPPRRRGSCPASASAPWRGPPSRLRIETSASS